MVREKEILIEEEYSRNNGQHLKTVANSIKENDESMRKFHHFLDDEELSYPEHPLLTSRGNKMFPKVNERPELKISNSNWKKHGSLSPRDNSQKKLISKENQVKKYIIKNLGQSRNL